VTTPNDDDELDVSHTSAVFIKPLDERRGKYLLFMTHLTDDDIPPIQLWHRLNEAHRKKALQHYMETPKWHAFAKTQTYTQCMHACPVRIRESL
jgi:hypothetical protein